MNTRPNQTHTPHPTNAAGPSSPSRQSSAARLPPTPAKELLAEFWKLEKAAEKMLEGLSR
ncbi:MAG: hypothetical protein HY360_17425 [Verrucomicrobia bacterium]|nr:hypothetical protein [Verrucomicrobiota bacterium]